MITKLNLQYESINHVMILYISTGLLSKFVIDYCCGESSGGTTVVTVVVCHSLLSLEVVFLGPTFDVVSTLYGTENDMSTSPPSFCLRTVCVICCASLARMEEPPLEAVVASPRGTV